METLGWAATELAGADLGDERRNRRLIGVVEALAARPEGSVPQACADWAATKGAYRLWDLDTVEPEALRTAGVPAVLGRVREHARVLVVQDTTEIAVRAPGTAAVLGRLRAAGQRGLLVHSALAVSPDGVPLGLLHQTVWTRDPAETGKAATRRQRPITDKESGRWLIALTASQAVLPTEVASVTIADREADIYELFAAPRRAHDDLLIRAAQDRCVVGEAHSLWATLAQAPAAGDLTVALRRRDEQPPRTAVVTLRFARVTLLPPRNHPDRATLAPLTLWAVTAEEAAPPGCVDPVRWRLLTTLPVPDFAAAVEIVRLYTLRWLIERYHFVLKSGCGVEDLRLETVERLERAVATYALVAQRLLWLTYQARRHPDASCDTILATHEWQALFCIHFQTPLPPATPPALHDAVRWIAQLGGFLARRHDGDPGVVTIWRGLRRLDDIAAVWLLLQSPPPPT